MNEPSNQLVLVANRLPLAAQAGPEAGGSWVLSPGGLVSALLPVAREYGATWVGFAGADDIGAPPETFAGINMSPVQLEPEEVKGYYSGFSNSVLWPLSHGRSDLAQYQEHDLKSYRDVNQKFADAAMREAAPGATVWVHDYHLYLVPKIIKEQRPDLNVGFFLHIPAIEPTEFISLPFSRELLDGFLAADVVGVQSGRDMQNISACVTAFGASLLNSEDEEQLARFQEGLKRVWVLPISVDPRVFLEEGQKPLVPDEKGEERFKFSRHDFRFLGVDRLDYSKGIIQRIDAFERLLERVAPVIEPILLQVLAPTRSEIGAYRDLSEAVKKRTREVNERFGNAQYTPIKNLFENLPPADIMPLYRRTDALIVSATKDGMNLVAKEFVATRNDNRGVLVLSRLAGSADELGEAVLIDPLESDGFARGLFEALNRSAEESENAMRQMRKTVRAHTARDWALQNLKLLNFARA